MDNPLITSGALEKMNTRNAQQQAEWEAFQKRRTASGRKHPTSDDREVIGLFADTPERREYHRRLVERALEERRPA